MALQAARSSSPQLKDNQHEVFIVSFEEMDAIIRSHPNGKKPSVVNAWKQLKPAIENNGLQQIEQEKLLSYGWRRQTHPEPYQLLLFSQPTPASAWASKRLPMV